MFDPMIGDLKLTDDGSIQRAFDELDARMDAWLEAMNATQQRLAEASVHPVNTEPGPDINAVDAVQTAESPVAETEETVEAVIKRIGKGVAR